MFEINKDTIIKINNPILRMECKKETFPLSDHKKSIVNKMRQYLVDSNDEKIATIKNLEPGVGIAAPQIGINSQMCVVYVEDDEGEVIADLQLINPKIIKKSRKYVYLESGEGCLSIPQKKDGYVLRNQQITVEYFDIEGKPHTITATDYLAIVIQHEIDHLHGKLYIDYIDDNDPYKTKKDSTPL